MATHPNAQVEKVERQMVRDLATATGDLYQAEEEIWQKALNVPEAKFPLISLECRFPKYRGGERRGRWSGRNQGMEITVSLPQPLNEAAEGEVLQPESARRGTGAKDGATG